MDNLNARTLKDLLIYKEEDRSLEKKIGATRHINRTCVLSRKGPDESDFALIKISDNTNPLDNLHSSKENPHFFKILNKRYLWKDDNCPINFDVID